MADASVSSPPIKKAQIPPIMTDKKYLPMLCSYRSVLGVHPLFECSYTVSETKCTILDMARDTFSRDDLAKIVQEKETSTISGGTIARSSATPLNLRYFVSSGKTDRRVGRNVLKQYGTCGTVKLVPSVIPGMGNLIAKRDSHLVLGDY